MIKTEKERQTNCQLHRERERERRHLKAGCQFSQLEALEASCPLE